MHQPVLQQFHNRLIGAVGRSPLLRLSLSRTGRLLDCTRLDIVEAGLGRRLLDSIVEKKDAVVVDLRLRPKVVLEGWETLSEEERRSRLESLPKTRDEQQQLYDTLDRRIQRFAELLRRETGVRSLWLGYPLLYLSINEADAPHFVLAPIFLWPITIALDYRHEGRVLVRRGEGPAKFNLALSSWVERQLGVKLPKPDEGDLEDFSWSAVQAHLDLLSGCIQGLQKTDCTAPLEPVPSTAAPGPAQGQRLFNSAVLGIFRWANEAIVADIEELKTLEEINGVAAAFVSGTQLRPPLPKIGIPPEKDRYEVCDADLYQQRVIWQSRETPGAVVHGPPGTGKSQTIVNIIADALAHGKTVLMVCQKSEATSIVFKHLRQVGLDHLCLWVNDSERDRREVFKAIRAQAANLHGQIGNLSALAEREKLAADIGRLEEQLDAYARGLHERQPEIGLSYRDIKDLEGKTHIEFPSARPLTALQTGLDAISFPQLNDLCHEIEQSGNTFAAASPLKNPWRYRHASTHDTTALLSDVQEVTRRLHELNRKHMEYLRQHGVGIEIPAEVADSEEALHTVLGKLDELARSTDARRGTILRAWLSHVRGVSPEVQAALRNQCEHAAQLARQVAGSPLNHTWQARLKRYSDADRARLFACAHSVLKYKDRWYRSLKPSYREGRRWIISEGWQIGDEEPAIWTVAQQLVAFAAALELRTAFRHAMDGLVPGVQPPEAEAEQLQFAVAAEEDYGWCEWASQLAQRFPWLSRLIDAIGSGADGEEFSRATASIRSALGRLAIVNEITAALEELAAFLQRDALDEPLARARTGDSISEWLELLVEGLNRLPDLDAWDARRNQSQEPLKSLLAALQEYEQRRSKGASAPLPPNDLPGSAYGRWWSALVRLSAADLWESQVRARHPALVAITPELRDQMVNRLKEFLGKKRDLESPVIGTRRLHAQRLLPTAPGDWNKMFQLRRSKAGPAKRLREAVYVSLPSGLLTMRPCWLANPAVVSEVFPLEPGLFDLVIFDEASQCPLEHAVAAIYRGKSVVIAGDEKQLPPTSFFQSAWSSDRGDDENEDQEASTRPVTREEKLSQMSVDYLLQVDNLLEAAIGNLPEHRLNVHYRSRHPALIEFNNHAFYGGKLEAPPPRMMQAKGQSPIRFYQVNGTYDQRTNRDEAGRVVGIVKDLWEKPGDIPTLGVVTFNAPQRDLIEDFIEEECQRDEQFSVRYQEQVSRREENRDIGFFVKNLENVQGDERDVMIFSTTFGRDATGRFLRRFGPVGAEGGERRLNVATSRAKEEVIIVCSMPVQEIATALAAASAPGAQLTPACYLQLYLAYARAVSDGDDETVRSILERTRPVSGPPPTGPLESFFEEDVYNALTKLGYRVDCQVGDSGFRIDLAVAAPVPRSGYMLGIECDGATYHSDLSARLRDIWRERILHNRGWRFHRIWSTRWWHQRNEEIEKLKVTVEDAAERFFEVDEFWMQIDPWEVTLAAWRKRKEMLLGRYEGATDPQAKERVGGQIAAWHAWGTDHAHRVCIQDALAGGRLVPAEVLADYPDLAGQCGRC